MQKEDILLVKRVENANDQIGIRIKDRKVEISIPNFLHLENELQPTKNDKQLLLSFIRSIDIAKTLNKEKLNKEIVDKKQAWPIESYLWLVRDYIKNGFYMNRDKLYFSDNKGKIEWKKTIKNMPIISNGNVIYDKLITSRISPQNSEITNIYKLCLNEASEKMKWLFNIDIKIDVMQSKSPNEMIYIVKKELSNTFDDEKRMRFNHMIRVLESVEHDDMLSNNYTYWINNYYYVFEQMVDSMFKGITNKIEKKKYNPSGFWKLNGQKEEEASNLRPDTIYEGEDNKLFIIDAKMYQFGFTKNFGDLPDTSSIQKQITYGDYVVNSIDRSKDVRNAFVLPYDKELDKFKNDPNIIKLDEDGNLSYVGEAYAGWRNGDKQENHERIFTFLIDFNHLLENYKYPDSKNINNLCNAIDDLLNNKTLTSK